jgi:hypothetical protein
LQDVHFVRRGLLETLEFCFDVLVLTGFQYTTGTDAVVQERVGTAAATDTGCTETAMVTSVDEGESGLTRLCCCLLKKRECEMTTDLKHVHTTYLSWHNTTQNERYILRNQHGSHLDAIGHGF